MRVNPSLIFDVGVCSGNDSAYYLHKGYRVVGIEANPVMIPRIRERFAREIAEGHYCLVPKGIAQSEGDAPFWVCEDVPDWSSFDRAIASYNNSRHHQVIVPTCAFESIIARFGIPFFCKIDIEGNDELCLRGFRRDARPEFVSVEVPLIGTGLTRGAGGRRLIELLTCLGYTRFKIISQVTYRQPNKAFAHVKATMPAPVSRWITAAQSLFRKRWDGDWRFLDGCSGPFGDVVPGGWLNSEDAAELSFSLEKNADLSDWWDIHATF